MPQPPDPASSAGAPGTVRGTIGCIFWETPQGLAGGAQLPWGKEPHQRAAPSACLPLSSPLLHNQLTFLSQSRWFLCSGFTLSSSRLSVILKLTLFLPLPGGILATLLGKIAGLFSLLRYGNASLLAENHLLHLTG